MFVVHLGLLDLLGLTFLGAVVATVLLRRLFDHLSDRWGAKK